MKPRRRRRIGKWIALAFVLAVLFAGGVIQVVLWSDVPRSIVADEIAEATGLRVELDALATGWSGETELSGLRLYTVDSAEALVWVTNATAQHTNLVALLLGFDLTINAIEADEVKVALEQKADGQWDVQQVVAGWLESSGEGELVSAPPSVHIASLSVTAAGSDGREAGVSDVRVEVEPIGPAGLRFTAGSAGIFSAEGDVSLRGEFPHSLSLVVDDLERVAGPWLADWTEGGVSGDLDWRGTLRGDELNGRLDVKSLRVDTVHIAGQSDVSTDFETVRLDLGTADIGYEPEGDDGREFRVDGGEIEATGREVRWRGVGVADSEVRLRSTGRYDFATDGLALACEWKAGYEDIGVTHEGSVDASLTRSPRGLRLEVSGDMRGEADAIRWRFPFSATASGEAWRSFEWSVSLGEGVLRTDVDLLGDEWREIQLAGLNLRGRAAWPRIEIEELRHSDLGLTGGPGTLEWPSLNWSAKLIGDAVAVTALADEPIDFEVTAHGGPDYVDLDDLRLIGPGFAINTNGSFHPSRASGDPLELNVTAAAWRGGVDSALVRERIMGRAQAVETGGDSAAQVADRGPWSATVVFDGRVSGSVSPPGFTASGKLFGDQLKFGERSVADLALDVVADYRDDRWQVRAEPVAMFEGTAGLEAVGGIGGESITVRVDLDGADLQQFAAMINPDLIISGTTSADLLAEVPIAAPLRTTVTGDIEVEDFRLHQIAFDRLSGKIRSDTAGHLILDPIRVAYGDGRAEGKLSVDMEGRGLGEGLLKLREWPLRIEQPEAQAIVTGDVELQMKLVTGELTGGFNVLAELAVVDEPVGSLDVEGRWDGSNLQINLDDSSIFGGSVTGSAEVVPDDWRLSTGEFGWTGIAPSALSRWLSEASEISGSSNGLITFGKSEGPHALEPFRIDLRIESDEIMRYRGVEWGPITAAIHAGERRWIVDPLEARAADGTLRLWASFQEHESQWHDHFHLSLDRVDFGTLYHVLDLQPEVSVPGRVSGELIAYGPLADWLAHSGRGNLRIDETDLRDTGLVGPIIGLLGLGAKGAIGVASLELRLQRQILTIRSLAYRYGSAEIVARGVAENIDAGVASPIRGQAVASSRPLRDISLPGFDDIDRLLSSFQSNVTAIKINGSIEEPKIEQARLSEIWESVRRLFTGEGM